MDNEITPREKAVNSLSIQLDKARATGEFINSNGGKVLLDVLAADITRFRMQIESNKFIADHDGYLDARARLDYAKNLTSRLVKVGDPDLPQIIQEQINLAQSDG